MEPPPAPGVRSPATPRTSTPGSSPGSRLQARPGTSLTVVMRRTNSFKDSDKYVRTKSGTYVRRDSDSYRQRKESTGMPDFRYGNNVNVDTSILAVFNYISTCTDVQQFTVTDC